MGIFEATCPFKMKLLLLLPTLVLASSAVQAESEFLTEFHNFMLQHGKTYKTKAEAEMRYNIFKKNLMEMNLHNTKSGASYKKGINKFSDMTDAEVSLHYLGGYKPISIQSTGSPSTLHTPKDLPASVDWRDACTPVKDQGQCGSCWAFAATEVIESHVKISSGSLPILSPQQMTSCTPNPLTCGGSGGCTGSICELGYNYIQLFGHVTEEDYPYISGTTMDSEECTFDISTMKPVAGLTGYNTLPSNDQEAIMTALATVGPLAVGVDASKWSRYGGGVFEDTDFEANMGLSHAVVLIGYGADEAEGDFWMIRNSWGEGWGEGGYIRLRRTKEPQCGTNFTPEGGACEGGPGNDPQTVCGECGLLYTASYPLGAHSIQN